MKIPDLVGHGARVRRRYLARARTPQPAIGRARRSWSGKPATVLLATAAALALGVLGTSALAQAAATPGHPLPPAGYRPAAAAHPLPPAGWRPPARLVKLSDPSRIPGVRVRTVGLPAAVCHAWNRKRPGAAPNCRALLYSRSVSHQPLPAGTRMAGTAQSASANSGDWWQWWNRNDICSWMGCSVDDLWTAESGVSDYYNIWNWWQKCGGGTITWCGNSNNGGNGIEYDVAGYNVHWFPDYWVGSYEMHVWVDAASAGTWITYCSEGAYSCF